MPVIREVKSVSAELVAQFNAYGPCLREGMEVWRLTGRLLRVGRVRKIVRGVGVYLETPRGEVFVNPTQAVVFAAPDSRMSAAVKLGADEVNV